jgi:hypothetical protein
MQPRPAILRRGETASETIDPTITRVAAPAKDKLLRCCD